MTIEDRRILCPDTFRRTLFIYFPPPFHITDLDDRMAAAERAISDLQAAVNGKSAGTDDDSSLDARVTKLRSALGFQRDPSR